MRGIGAFVTDYAKQYGDRAGKDVIRLLEKIWMHSCIHEEGPIKKKHKPTFGQEPEEAYLTYGDIAMCRQCERKVNYCCKLHQTII
jgi:hypothetical protein